MKTNSTRLLMLAALLSTAALAQAPNRVAYQGLLLKADGTPETGMVSIKFSVFDLATNGSELWTETQPNVVLTQGFYSTVLGEVTAFPNNLLDGSERYLELSVGGTALSPRMRVVSVPYAVRSNSAQNVTGGTVNASSISVNGTTVIDGTGALAGNTAYTGVNGISVTGRNIGLRSSCQAGEILRWDVTSTSWICAPFAAASSDGGAVTYNADPDGGLVLTGTNFTTFSLLRSCAANQILKWSGNAWVCADDANDTTTYSVAAGQGLATSGAGNTLFGLQLCPLGQVLKSGAGTWACAADTDTTYTAPLNKGLLLTGTGFGIDACPSGQVMKSTGGGNWACAADGDTLFDVITAAGIRRAGNNFGLEQCPSGQVLKSGGSGVWGCQPDNDSLGTVTQITANNGLTGGVINTVGTIGLAPTVPNWTFATPGFCAPGSVLRVLALDGTPTCQPIAAGGTVTSITAGTGIVTNPDAGITISGTIAVAPTVQNWVAGQPNCPAGQAIASIAANGTPNCVTISLDGGGGGGGSVTSVGSGPGLTGGPITGSGSLSIAAAGVTNAMIANPSVTVTAGTGLSGGGTVALGGSTSISLSTPVGIASGGTGTTQSPTGAGQYLRSSAPGAWSVATIPASDLPNLNSTYVDLASNQTITGVKTFNFNIVGNLTGNASTVTNGVYTNSSYADPAFITSLAGSKISGNITGNSAGFSGSLGGDVTGVQANTVVGGLQGRPLAATAPASGQVVGWNGSTWLPASITGTAPVAVTLNNIALTTCGANQVYKMNSSGTAWGCTDLGVQTNQGLQVDGAYRFGLIACGNSQVLRFDTGTGQWSCSNITNAMIQGPINIVNGGTGATTAATARVALGAAGSGANSDITSLSGLSTALSIAQGGTGTNSSPTVAGQYLRSSGAGAYALTTGIPVGDLPATGGDIAGALNNVTVTRIQNRGVSNTAPLALQALGWTGATWAPQNVVTSVATGGGLTGGPITTTGTIQIAASGVTSGHIADGTIVSGDIADGNVLAADIGTGAVGMDQAALPLSGGSASLTAAAGAVYTYSLSTLSPTTTGSCFVQAYAETSESSATGYWYLYVAIETNGTDGQIGPSVYSYPGTLGTVYSANSTSTTSVFAGNSYRFGCRVFTSSGSSFIGNSISCYVNWICT